MSIEHPMRLETLDSSLRPIGSRDIVRADALFPAVAAALKGGELVRLVGDHGRRIQHRDVDTLDDIRNTSAQRSCGR